MREGGRGGRVQVAAAAAQLATWLLSHSARPSPHKPHLARARRDACADLEAADDMQVAFDVVVAVSLIRFDWLF